MRVQAELMQKLRASAISDMVAPTAQPALSASDAPAESIMPFIRILHVLLAPSVLG